MFHVRRIARLGPWLVLSTISTLSSGCVFFNSDDQCFLCVRLPSGSTGMGGGGGTGGAGGSSGSSGTGGTGGGNTSCIPSESTAPVDDSCGVFVSSSLGTDGNAGIKQAPAATLGKAIEMAEMQGKPVYACAETFTETVVVSSGITVYGGLDCGNDWGYIGANAKTTLTAGPDEIPLQVVNTAARAEWYDFRIQAVNAMTPGSSSIAVLVSGSAAELVRCELIAGDGARGAAGEAGDPNGNPASAGAKGNDGHNACSDLDMMGGPDATLPGGPEVTNDCGMGDVSIGGKGGDGDISAGSDGAPGMTGTFGQAGLGEPAMGAWACAVGSGLGNAGSPGASGTPGAGATGLGSVSAMVGFTGSSGQPGTPGKAGQGGGGGGGAKGGNICSGMMGSGASGGSGGAGGCGGLPGKGGGPGGASIALVSSGSAVTLTACTLIAGKGGDGGAGGDLQAGGQGGLSGLGGQGAGSSNPACDGGKGGKGGNGGHGGGGLGGHSLGIAYSGTTPFRQTGTVVTFGSAGLGGPGGNANEAMNAGENGKAAEQQQFP